MHVAELQPQSVCAESHSYKEEYQKQRQAYAVAGLADEHPRYEQCGAYEQYVLGCDVSH